MPKIAAVTTAVPPHVVLQDQARTFAERYFRLHRRDVERLAAVFEHTGIEKRHICVPSDWFEASRSFEEKNALYIDWATRLGVDVVRAGAEKAGVPTSEITHIVFVSTTGLATPSVDSRIANVLGLSPHIVRTPIWGLGCAGGASGLSLAYRLAKGDPQALIALVCVELCSITFHFGDFSKSNFVATSLFADGAAGVLVAGDERAASIQARGPAINASLSTTWPDSLDVMGWNFDSVGMQVVFSRAIPQIVQEKARTNCGKFLSSQGLDFDKIDHFVAHPGGAKVIEAYQEALPLRPCAMTHARTVLRDYGNMSSPTVLFVLDRLLDSGAPKDGDHALLTALGPGFSSEQVLLQF
jgi:alkylresorcinol/alkylpyrone synthase